MHRVWCTTNKIVVQTNPCACMFSRVCTCLHMPGYCLPLPFNQAVGLCAGYTVCVCVYVCACACKFCVSARIPASHFCAHDYSHMYLRARPKCVQRALVEKTLNLLNIGSTKRYSTSALRTRIKRLSRGLSRLKLCKCTL